MCYKNRTGFLAALLMSMLFTSCTFIDGQAWGEIESISFVAEFPVSGSRLVDETTLATNNNFHISIDAVVVEYSGVRFLMSEEGESASFDPSNPPEGCGLCHNGHCHCGDELVSYEDLQTQVVSAGGGATLDLPMTDDMPSFILNSEQIEIPVFSCGAEDPCYLERGTLSAITVSVKSVYLEATVTDTREGDSARLTDPVQVRHSFPTSVDMNSVAEETFDKNTTAGLTVELAHQIPATLFDGIEEWANLEESEQQIGESIGGNMSEAEGLSVLIEREKPFLLGGEGATLLQ